MTKTRRNQHYKTRKRTPSLLQKSAVVGLTETLLHTFHLASGSSVHEGWKLGSGASGHLELLPSSYCQWIGGSVDLARILS